MLRGFCFLVSFQAAALDQSVSIECSRFGTVQGTENEKCEKSVIIIFFSNVCFTSILWRNTHTEKWKRLAI
jgi:hypothetical protein